MKTRGIPVLALLLALLPGCVERALVITTEPSGADVTVNQQWKGKTPYVLPFKHYGVYDIWIEHPGVEDENGKAVKFYPMHVGEPVKAPGYQYPVADFVSEVLLPKTLYDQRDLHYVLERVDQADSIDDVLTRAQQMREARIRRAEMRTERDIEIGRIEAPTPEATFVESSPLGTGETYVQAPDYVVLDATPPLPSEVPLFLP